MCVCVYVCVFVCVCVCVSVCETLCFCVGIGVRVGVTVGVGVGICLCLCLYVCTLLFLQHSCVRDEQNNNFSTTKIRWHMRIQIRIRVAILQLLGMLYLGTRLEITGRLEETCKFYMHPALRPCNINWLRHICGSHISL